MAGRKGGEERYAYEPDYATAPGEILQETIDALGMTQKELAARTGYTPKHINLLISGKARITPESALRLEKVTGVPAHFWNNLECQYQEHKARLEAAASAEEEIDWLREIPVKELVSRRVLPNTRDKLELFRAALRFFQVASVGAWRKGWSHHQIAFRKAAGAEACTGGIAAWVRLAGNTKDMHCNLVCIAIWLRLCKPFGMNGIWLFSAGGLKSDAAASARLSDK